MDLIFNIFANFISVNLGVFVIGGMLAIRIIGWIYFYIENHYTASLDDKQKYFLITLFLFLISVPLIFFGSHYVVVAMYFLGYLGLISVGGFFLGIIIYLYSFISLKKVHIWIKIFKNKLILLLVNLFLLSTISRQIISLYNEEINEAKTLKAYDSLTTEQKQKLNSVPSIDEQKSHTEILALLQRGGFVIGGSTFSDSLSNTSLENMVLNLKQGNKLTKDRLISDIVNGIEFNYVIIAQIDTNSNFYKMQRSGEVINLDTFCSEFLSSDICQKCLQVDCDSVSRQFDQ